jgi:hypothetical protein
MVRVSKLKAAKILLALECIPIIGTLFFIPTLIVSILAMKKDKDAAKTILIWSIAVVLLQGFLQGVISAFI